MTSQTMKPQAINNAPAVTEMFLQVRAQTIQIVAPLEIEDYVIQTADFMSPPRWHIGHTSWFFETLLQTYQPEYLPYSDDFLFYFNSYYEGFGPRIERARRGLRSRPTVKQTLHYRVHIDEAMLRFLERVDEYNEAEKILALVRMGIEHEMQHQELLVYDIKHLLCDLYEAPRVKAPDPVEEVTGMVEIAGGLIELGAADQEFAWDNEKPRHSVFLVDYALDRAPVSNADYLEFIESGGYSEYRWWLSAGWELGNRERWNAPLYWENHGGEWMIRDYHGLHPVAERAQE
ncbi:MAG TPA: SUMF1/EgtB/PvdO family nonheme iron enzyme, partial [Blastocatellia bacterium]|nr:SUMF1/EgtB/PvdO family nonheme iron enzyme [Blastocatellia bacterium]